MGLVVAQDAVREELAKVVLNPPRQKLPLKPESTTASSHRYVRGVGRD